MSRGNYRQRPPWEHKRRIRFPLAYWLIPRFIVLAAILGLLEWIISFAG